MNKLTTYRIVVIRESIYRDIAYRGYITGLGMVLWRFAVVEIVLESSTPPHSYCLSSALAYIFKQVVYN